MSDSFTETTSTSWFSRIGKAFKGIVVGFILFIVAFPLLFWNEGRTIKQTKSLKETEAGLVLAKCDEVNQDNEGKPVYMTGDAITEDVLADDVFPVSINGFKLKRNVEMYQWVEHEKSETKKKLGGGEETVTTYTYSKEWSDRPINSGQFKQPAEHENPAWDFENAEYEAKTGTIGVFTLSESIIGRINWYEPYKVEIPKTPETPETQPPAVPETPAVPDAPAAAETPVVPDNPAVPDLPSLEDVPALEDAPTVPDAPAVEDAPALPDLPALPTDTTSDETPAETPAAADATPTSTLTTETAVSTSTVVPATTGIPEGYIYYNGGFYKGDPQKLAIGDVRVSFEYVPATETISLISGQQGDTFAPYQTKHNAIELVAKGVKSPEEMFKDAHRANSILCWALRLIGFMLMFFGLKMIFEPLKVIADVVPFIGTIIGMGTGFIAFVLAAGFSLLTISIGWLAYRPLIGIPILIAALVFLFMPLFKGKKKAAVPQPETPFEK